MTRTVVDCCAEQTYPTTTDQFAAEHGGTELQLPGGVVTLGEVLGWLPGQELETPADAQLLVWSALGEKAIGRKEYSDRDPRCPGEGTTDQVSL